MYANVGHNKGLLCGHPKMAWQQIAAQTYVPMHKCWRQQAQPTLLAINATAHKAETAKAGLAMYLPTSAHYQVAATILFDLVLAFGAGLGIGVEPVCCLTVITALALPLLPPDETVAKLSIACRLDAVGVGAIDQATCIWQQ